jgi:predicted MFS family arabinose efflux permease
VTPTTAERTSHGVRRQRLGLLHERGFRLLWTGETASALGTNVSRLALPLVAVISLHASAFAVSLLTAASWVPWLLVGLPAGAWVDRLPRRPVMVACDVTSLVLMVSAPVAAWAGVLTFAHLLVVALLVGAAGVFFSTAYQVYLPDLIHPRHLTEANAKLQGSESAAQVAGPGVAGFIAQSVGAIVGLVADSVSFAVSACCLLLIRTPEQPIPASQVGSAVKLRQQVGEGLKFVAADRYLRALTGYGALSNCALTGYQAILVVFLVRDVQVRPTLVGVLLSGMSVGGLLGASVATTLGRRLGTARATLVANLAAGPFALLIPLTTRGPGLWFVVTGGLGVGAAVVAGNVLKTSFRQAYTPRPLMGRVVVSMQFVNYGAIPAGALVAGAIAGPLGLRATLWIMAAGVAIAPLTLLPGPLRRARDYPDRPI